MLLSEIGQGGIVNTLCVVCPSTGGHEEAVESWQSNQSVATKVALYDATEGDEAGFLTKCDKAWRENEADVIGYLHSDLFIHEKDWDVRVLKEFENPNVGVVGFVGATGLASDDIYKIKYDYRQLARENVYSNLTDADVHGQRFAESREVAVVDSCAVFVRRGLLSRCGGWPIHQYPNSSHCSDLWICCIARRHNSLVRVVGVSCTHRSGGKGDAGTKWLNDRGGDEKLHRDAHKLIYNDFRDVLPIRIP